MALKFKVGVQLTVTETVNKILSITVPIYAAYGADCVVTSGTDGKHDPNSKHYTGNALDFRVSHVQPENLDPLVKTLKKACGENFFVLFEGDHIHIQTPKGK